MIPFVGYFFTSAVTWIVAYAILARVSVRWSAAGPQDQHVPNVGAALVALAIAASIYIAAFVGQLAVDSRMIIAFSGLAGVTLIGFIDDRRPLTWKTKLLWISLSALPLAVMSMDIVQHTSLANSSLRFLIPVFVWFASIVVINGVNLMDGIDGYVGGWAIVTLLGFVAFIPGGFSMFLTAALLLALLAFIAFNWSPARVYLGDAGSLPLGYVAAMLATLALAEAATPSRVLALVVLCGMPLAEVVITASRRLIAGRHVCTPDFNHVHHRLNRGAADPALASKKLLACATFLAVLSVIVGNVNALAAASVFWAAIAIAVYLVMHVYVTGPSVARRSVRSAPDEHALNRPGTP